MCSYSRITLAYVIAEKVFGVHTSVNSVNSKISWKYLENDCEEKTDTSTFIVTMSGLFEVFLKL